MIKLAQLLKEASSKDHSHDRDMVVGVAEILRMVDDMDNRDDIADEMMDKFDREDVNYDVDEFLQMCGLNPINEEQTTPAPMLNKPKIPMSSKGVKRDPIPNREKAKTDADKIKQQQTRLGIMRQQLKLPKSSQQRTKLQRRIVKANQKLTALKTGKNTQ
jgi:predicted DNA-binding protein YlxM (UPF0122 family)